MYSNYSFKSETSSDVELDRSHTVLFFYSTVLASYANAFSFRPTWASITQTKPLEQIKNLKKKQQPRDGTKRLCVMSQLCAVLKNMSYKEKFNSILTWAV